MKTHSRAKLGSKSKANPGSNRNPHQQKCTSGTGIGIMDRVGKTVHNAHIHSHYHRQVGRPEKERERERERERESAFA
ncbi:hypothetical protein EVAR_53789_1 [Eumeta japonica]|uniref:Uncharacterized protein n=1 Tax=Eumeta variegata TaxID=151549 RepID=A0A4C1XXF2_EUMVA|nr:hypothetical protein EVAR_53789_1 [Eumeta japonica]